MKIYTTEEIVIEYIMNYDVYKNYGCWLFLLGRILVCTFYIHAKVLVCYLVLVYGGNLCGPLFRLQQKAPKSKALGEW